MPVARSIGAVIAGYLVFALSAFAIFQLSGQAPHAAASTGFMAASVFSGVVFALAGGYVAAWLAGRRPLAHAAGVAAVILLGAVASLAATVGHGATWSQVAAIVLMAPAAVLGGQLRARAVARSAAIT